MKLSEVFKKARAKVEGSWGQRAAVGANGAPYCVGTAIEDVAEVGTWSDAITAFLKANDLKTDIVKWNDSPSRTKEEVLKAFDRAIATALADEEGVTK